MPITAKDRLRYAKKHASCLLNENFGDLMLLTDSQRVHTLKALATLSKFLGVYERFRRLVKNHGLKWAGKSGDDLIIDRLTRAIDPNEIFDWITEVKKVAPELCSFMDLISVAGIRYSEAIESYNLVIHLARKGRLSEYFNEERQILEHYRFKEIFIRNSKKLFVSFVPKRVIARIEENSEPLEWNPVKKLVARRVGRLRFGDIREFWASIMTKSLRQPEIDFLQGRISSSVFMRHYFNPAWITDLKDRTLKAAGEILEKIE